MTEGEYVLTHVRMGKQAAVGVGGVLFRQFAPLWDQKQYFRGFKKVVRTYSHVLFSRCRTTTFRLALRPDLLSENGEALRQPRFKLLQAFDFDRVRSLSSTVRAGSPQSAPPSS